jgi:hypothetical protein
MSNTTLQPGCYENVLLEEHDAGNQYNTSFHSRDFTYEKYKDFKANARIVDNWRRGKIFRKSRMALIMARI